MQDSSASRPERATSRDFYLLGISGPLRRKWHLLRPGSTHFGRAQPEGDEWSRCDQAALVPDDDIAVSRHHAIIT